MKAERVGDGFCELSCAMIGTNGILSRAGCAIVLLAAATGCASGPRQSDIDAVKIRLGYSRAKFQEDIATIRGQHWPNRSSGGDEAYVRVFEQVDFKGVSRRAVLRMLGPADGYLVFDDPPPPKHTMFAVPPPKIPRLVKPRDDRLIYRLGDGHNHGSVYSVLFARGRVSRVLIQAGY